MKQDEVIVACVPDGIESVQVRYNIAQRAALSHDVCSWPARAICMLRTDRAA